MNDAKTAGLLADPAREVLTSDGKTITVRELAARVILVEPCVLRLLEVPRPTVETLDVMGSQIEALTAGLRGYGIFIDLSESQSTTGDYRRYIPKFFSRLTERSKGALRQVAVPVQLNPVVRVATKFIVSRMADAPFEVYESPEAAFEGLRAAVADCQPSVHPTSTA